MASIKIATGVKTYDIEDQFGNVRGQLKFNPSDMNFVSRLAQLESKLTSYLDEYSKLADELSQTPSTESQDVSDELYSEAQKILATLSYYDIQVKKVINETFNDDNLSKIVFGDESAFNIFEGQTFLHRFLDGVMPIIKADVEAATAQINERTAKYTAQLHEQ